MQQKDLVQGALSFALEDRDYDTIRNAIARGMNRGAFGLDEDNKVSTWEWRLMGDRVEVREVGKINWRFLDFNDLDFVFSRGVYGLNVEYIYGFSCYDIGN